MYMCELDMVEMLKGVSPFVAQLLCNSKYKAQVTAQACQSLHELQRILFPQMTLHHDIILRVALTAWGCVFLLTQTREVADCFRSL